jgi:hypothetical protein
MLEEQVPVKARRPDPPMGWSPPPAEGRVEVPVHCSAVVHVVGKVVNDDSTRKTWPHELNEHERVLLARGGVPVVHGHLWCTPQMVKSSG